MKGATSSDDSGFFDDSEAPLDDSITFSDNVVMVEDDAFNIIESSLEALLQEENQDENEEPCETVETNELLETSDLLETSELENCEPIETSTPQPERRKRGRPAKVKPFDKHLTSEESDNTELAQKTLGKKRGRPVKNNNLAKDDEELLLLEEESPVKKIKVNGLTKTKKKTKPSLPDYEDLSPKCRTN